MLISLAINLWGAPLMGTYQYYRGKDTLNFSQLCLKSCTNLLQLESVAALTLTIKIINCFIILAILSGSSVTTALCLLRSRMEETASRYRG